MTEKEHNLQVAATISAEFVWDGQTFHEGDCVALLDGKIVAVTDNPGEAISALRSIDPDPDRGMVVEVTLPVVDVIRQVQR